MKKLILLLALFSIQSCISVRFNTTSEHNKEFKNVSNPNITATGTFLDFEVKDENWGNENTFNSTFARFKNSRGNSSIKLKVDQQSLVEFNHKVKTDGSLKFEIINQKDEVIFTKDFNSNVEDNFNLELKKGEYIVKWTANNATGSYFLEWKEK